jgi:organic hydroperoxide reductase OsmC/OhrA
MSEHRATIQWRASGGAFTANRYSRAHSLSFDGGAEVPASASPQVVPEPMSDPRGVDPEEMLVASAASCHMLWFLDLARQAGLDVASYEDEAVGSLGRDAERRLAITRIVLRPRVEFGRDAPDASTLERLHHEAHERCFIANSLKTEIKVEPR